MLYRYLIGRPNNLTKVTNKSQLVISKVFGRSSKSRSDGAVFGKRLLHGEVHGTLTGNLGLNLGIRVALVGATDQCRKGRALRLEGKLASQGHLGAAFVADRSSVVSELIGYFQTSEELAIGAVVTSGNIKLLDISTIAKGNGNSGTTSEGTALGKGRHVEARKFGDVQLTNHGGHIGGVCGKKISLVGVISLEFELNVGHGTLEGSLNGNAGILVQLKLVDGKTRFVGPLGCDLTRKSRLGIVSSNSESDAMGSLRLDLQTVLRVIIFAKKVYKNININLTTCYWSIFTVKRELTSHSLVKVFELRRSHF